MPETTSRRRNTGKKENANPKAPKQDLKREIAGMADQTGREQESRKKAAGRPLEAPKEKQKQRQFAPQAQN